MIGTTAVQYLFKNGHFGEGRFLIKKRTLWDQSVFDKKETFPLGHELREGQNNFPFNKQNKK
jgi:hypothetical protein